MNVHKLTSANRPRALGRVRRVGRFMRGCVGGLGGGSRSGIPPLRHGFKHRVQALSLLFDRHTKVHAPLGWVCCL